MSAWLYKRKENSSVSFKDISENGQQNGIVCQIDKITVRQNVIFNEQNVKNRRNIFSKKRQGKRATKEHVYSKHCLYTACNMQIRGEKSFSKKKL